VNSCFLTTPFCFLPSFFVVKQNIMQMTKGLLFAAAAATTLILKADAFLPLQPATKYSSHVLPVHLAALTPTSLQPQAGAMRPLTASGGDGNGGESEYGIDMYREASLLR
jgi:hypothetical protein